MFLRIIVLFFLSPIAQASEPITNVHWASTLPPLIAILLAFLTRRIFLSLGLAVLVGSFIHASQLTNAIAVTGGISTFLGYFAKNLTDPWNLKVIAFVLCILSMITVIIIAGGFNALVNSVSQWANSRKKTQLMTYFCGLLVFIDDYANTMIVGSSMRPINDQYKVSREKLAFIVDATSAPVAGLAIISTWIGYEVGLFSDGAKALSLPIDGLSIFLDALVYRFYCILMLILVLISILTQREFGPMYLAEKRAITTGNLFDPSGNQYVKSVQNTRFPEVKNPSVSTALVPFILLFIILLAGLWMDGGGLTELSHSFFSIFYPTIWLNVIRHTENSSTILLSSAITGLITAIIFSLKKVQVKHILRALQSAFKNSLTPVGILLLAWSLKSVCNDLHTADFLVNLLSPHINPVFLPLTIFFIAAVTSFGTGTSWGTMAILIPITFPLAYALEGNSFGLITITCLAAVLDGSIFGDHCSPISDTTIMSSIASQCNHLDHVKTQLPYSLLTGLVAMFIGYLPAALGWPSWISVALGALFIYLFFRYAGKVVRA